MFDNVCLIYAVFPYKKKDVLLFLFIDTIIPSVPLKGYFQAGNMLHKLYWQYLFFVKLIIILISFSKNKAIFDTKYLAHWH